MQKAILDHILGLADPYLKKFGLNKTYIFGLLLIIVSVLGSTGKLPPETIEWLKGLITDPFVVTGIAGTGVLLNRHATSKLESKE